MMMRKACPRCRGDLFLDRNDGPTVLTCLQCGRSFAPAARQESVAPSRVPVGAAPGERAA